MGLFKRGKDSDGLYTGDAPVSAPGVDGAAPTAYLGIPAAAGTAAGTASAANADAAASVGGAAEPGGTGPAPSATSSTSSTSFSSSPPQVTVDIVTQMLRSAARQARPARRLGGVLVLVVVLVIAAAVGIPVYHAIKSAVAAADQAKVLTSPDGIGSRGLEFTDAGAPVSITLLGVPLEVTVFGAELQPGEAWGYASRGDAPQLIVAAELHRTDNGAEPIEVTGWDWSVVGADGKRVAGDIISHFQPSLDGPELVGGDTVRGFVAFATDTRNVRLSLAESAYGAALAAWKIEAADAQTTVGAVGDAVFGTIGRPGFTVTISETRSLADGDPELGRHPESGRFLVVDVGVYAIKWAEGHVGNVDDSDFVFVPDSGEAVQPAYGAVDEALSFFSIGADDPPQSARLAFDTAATAGTLQLRDGADRVIISWPVEVA